MTPRKLSDHAYNCDYASPDSVDPDYRYVVKLVLRATIFFRDGHTPAIRKALKACFDDYFSAFGKELQWGWEPQPAGKPTPRRFDEKLIDAMHDALDHVMADDAVELAFMSSLNQHYVGDYGIKCLTVPDWEQEIGRDGAYLSFFVPYYMVQDQLWDAGKFPLHDFMVACCNRLKATHGYAGFALALPHEYYRWEPYELELAKQYYGLEIDNPVNVGLMTDGWKGIKGVNWYTVIGRHYVDQLGGEASIRGRLADPLFRLYEIADGGLIIRAGEKPELGPIKEGLPPLYVAVNAVVNPVRTTDIRSFGLGSNAGELRFNKRLTDLWLRRFDAPGIWPPGTGQGTDQPNQSASISLADLMSTLPQMEIVDQPILRKTGERCPYSGKWGVVDMTSQEIIIEEGERMPQAKSAGVDAAPRDATWRLMTRADGGPTSESH